MGKKSEETIKNFTHKYAKVCVDHNAIDADLFDQYGVKRGLRDKNGKGVLSGLTNISLIKSSEEKDGKRVPCDGQLYYRGYNIFDLVLYCKYFCAIMSLSKQEKRKEASWTLTSLSFLK